MLIKLAIPTKFVVVGVPIAVGLYLLRRNAK
jgi:hypothetical protein